MSRIKPIFTLVFCLVTANFVVFCGKSKESDSSLDYRFLHSPFPSNPEYVDTETTTKRSLITKTLRAINIGVRGQSYTISNNDLRTIVLTWLAPLRQKSSQVTQTVNVSTNTGNADLIVNYTTNAGRSCGQTQTHANPYTIDYCPNDRYEGMLHEFGHGFGLGDTYDVKRGGGCVDGQPNSVMCSASSRSLMPDDIAGITALFCTYNNCNGGTGPIIDPGTNPIDPPGGDDWVKFTQQFKFLGTEKLKCSSLYITNLSGDKSVRIRSAPSISAPVVASLADGASITISGAIAGNEQTKVTDSDLARAGKKGSKGEPGVEYIWLKIAQPTQGWVSKMYAECR